MAHLSRVGASKIPGAVQAGVWASKKDTRWVDFDQLELDAYGKGKQCGVEWFGFFAPQPGPLPPNTLRIVAAIDEYAIVPSGFEGRLWEGTDLGIPEVVDMGCAFRNELSDSSFEVEIRIERKHPSNQVYRPSEAHDDFGYRLLAKKELAARATVEKEGESFGFASGSLDFIPLLRRIDVQNDPNVEDTHGMFYEGPAIDLQARLLVDGEWSATEQMHYVCLGLL